MRYRYQVCKHWHETKLHHFYYLIETINMPILYHGTLKSGIFNIIKQMLDFFFLEHVTVGLYIKFHLST